MSQTSKRPSLRRAINTHCKACIYDRTNGGPWRKQVENCTVTECELYPVRPLPKRNKLKTKSESARKNGTAEISEEGQV